MVACHSAVTLVDQMGQRQRQLRLLLLPPPPASHFHAFPDSKWEAGVDREPINNNRIISKILR